MQAQADDPYDGYFKALFEMAVGWQAIHYSPEGPIPFVLYILEIKNWFKLKEFLQFRHE
jgi:hypothetical protein